MKLLLIISIMLSSISAYSDEAKINRKIKEVNQEYSHKLTELVKSYDEKAFVHVSFSAQTIKVQLPLTNIITTKVKYSKSGKILMQSALVTTYSTKKELPPSFVLITNKIFTDYGVQPKFVTELIPTNKKDDKWSKEIFWLIGAGAFSLAILFISLFVGIRSGRKNSEIISKTLSSELKNLAHSFEDTGMNHGASQGSIETESLKGNISDNQFNMWREYDHEFIKSILSDCYWCEQDEYAAFIWGYLSPTQKNLVIDDLSFMTSYVNTLMHKKAKNLNFDQDPYYFSPEEISHINNEKLTEYVNKAPALYKNLSEMRKNHLNISVKERIKYLNTDQASHDLDFKIINSSEHRIVDQIQNLKINSLAEEEELLKSSDLDISIKKSILSLGWLLELEKEDIVNLLKPYNAKQLALLWIAPDFVLKELENYIPTRKKDLMHSYLEKFTPVRETNELKAIMKEAFSLLEQKQKAIGTLSNTSEAA